MVSSAEFFRGLIQRLRFDRGFRSLFILYSLVVLSLILAIAALSIARRDHFTDYAPDAASSGWYTTLHRECKPGLHRCKVTDAWGHNQYFCSSNCTLKPEHLKGEPLKEPIPWELRFA